MNNRNVMRLVLSASATVTFVFFRSATQLIKAFADNPSRSTRRERK